MPHRRKPEKGSFGGHFDELVKHFPHKQTAKFDDEEKRSKDDRDFHDRLFAIAWRASHEGKSRR
jgi:hypothetical protein